MKLVKILFSPDPQNFNPKGKLYTFRSKDNFRIGAIGYAPKYGKFLQVHEQPEQADAAYYSIKEDKYADTQINSSYFKLGEIVQTKEVKDDYPIWEVK